MRLSRVFAQPSNSSLYRVGFLVLVVSVFLVSSFAFAETTKELQDRIEEKNRELATLEEEIARYEAELTKVGADRKTLEAEIARLDLSRKKIATDISVTENRIVTTDLELDELGESIDDKSDRILRSTEVIERSLRTLAQIDTTTLFEYFLAGAAFSTAWESADQHRRVQTALTDEVVELEALRDALEDDYVETAKKQGQLVSYKKQLTGQKVVLDQNRQEQSTVLTATKSKESEYQALLRQKQEARAKIEAELREFEAELEYTLDPSKIPAAGSGVLKFPLDKAFMERCTARKSVFGNLYCITQYFGNTPFAQSGAYNGKGHNGTDFGAPEGTKIVAALSGVVVEAGNTDLIRGCYSYGKWVLVRHANGLSTLYAHLSHISVEAGEGVATGDLLGYSGNTGYSTGPHLHFTVYASDAVQIVRYGDFVKNRPTNCANARMPVAPTEGYLNPISYL